MGLPADEIIIPPRKFRKKFLVDAVQFNALGDHPSVIATDQSPTGFGIFTPESTVAPFEVTLGDWVLKGPKGEFYACKPDVFAQTYEEVLPPVVQSTTAMNTSSEPTAT